MSLLQDNYHSSVSCCIVLAGSKHAYCNLGYELLGRVIERVTGQMYGDYMNNILAEVAITNMALGKTKKEDTEPDEVGANMVTMDTDR